MKLVREAEAVEREFAVGRFLDTEQKVLLKAFLNDESGLWTLILELEHGKAFYYAEDEELTRITIKTVPSLQFIQQNSSILSTEVRDLRDQLSNEISIDLKNIESLKIAKQKLKKDFVLNNLSLLADDGTTSSAAELVVVHLRLHRKPYRDYVRNYGFLWLELGFKNASSLLRFLETQEV